MGQKPFAPNVRGAVNIANYDKDLSKKLIYYSDFLSLDDLSNIHDKCNSLQLRKLTYDAAPVGEHGYASARGFSRVILKVRNSVRKFQESM